MSPTLGNASAGELRGLFGHMKDVLLLLIHLPTAVAKLLSPGGVKGIIAENLLLKRQLLVVCRPR